MKLSDLICFDALIPRLDSQDRDGVIKELVSALAEAGKIKKTKAGEVAKAVIKRENEASTGIGKGVAVPHAKHQDVNGQVGAVGCKSDGIDFSSLDKKPVYSVILLLSPENDSEKHLQAMEKIFSSLQNEDFRKFLRQAATEKQLEEAIIDADENLSV